MRYMSEDLSLFALHDTVIEEISRDGADMRWRLGDANVLDTCPANPHGCAMRVSEMWLTFENAEIRKATVWADRSYDCVTKEWTEIPPRDIPPEHWWQSPPEKFMVLSAQEGDRTDGRRAFRFTIHREDIVDFEVLADGIRFEWDEFAGPAWFEKRSPG